MISHNDLSHTYIACPDDPAAADEFYMARALELARRGAGFVSPNPMVGAVIVADGRIIGQGWHRRYGGPHAEVNAVASVRPQDRHLLPEATIYVTLEPCSHYGKTPPCAKLLIDNKLKRVVVGAPDPFECVRGRGIKMLQEAGIEVTEGVLEPECMELNRRFMTAHTQRRPWVQLKWAQSADGFIAALDDNNEPQGVKLSSPISSVLMHRERAMADAVLVGSGTVLADRPRLDVRLWPARRNPLRVTIDRRKRLSNEDFGPADSQVLIFNADEPLSETLRHLYEEHGVTSLMVEGGTQMLESFIAAGLYDEIRVETAPCRLGRGVAAPRVPEGLQRKIEHAEKQLIEVFRR